ncbi:MarR family winged helix-turn-helix transcriptional regulator [Lactiplantibacillus mudanjiangensis]|uniref:MarR family transcriptional regulator [Lactobacillus sp.] n=1 Tax=Lactiplantibacillus mudanjiangensis TaxID=1296538 RepID=A0A660DXP9_9LACO|nr:MarR family winged helix-turn-helix transcriptional regulator [Lactiplantibacillus mudanjiangensis]VDG19433.1 MarR family transcriptional regulator [Lactobacillus sp.] [Lactiplantibacillus mudanjiangensis]VDG24996.1 MarR family transcriptional regulator [Lactobacillus sp.] [Lactiplantibacillus mudanjiangensis]VDG27988.1 MarR family transcriptional regulator [Lactobacillus sp.] [Lactiplantibacillus mudanjiangensis]VDG30887.1 MarR family transcriptional regulator [Lactobacillus sp.] [Lactiplan
MRKLEDHFCFLMYVTSRAIQRAYQPELAEQAITYPQYLVLVLLSEQSHLTVKAIGHWLDLSTGTVTPLLKRMDEEGLVNRQRSQTDERQVEVSITAAGLAKRAAISDLPETLVTQGKLTPEEWTTLTKLINKLMVNLK